MNREASSSQPHADADDLVGRVLSNRYRIVAKLGAGAMGDVYVAEHLTIGRRDAIKVLRPGLAQDPEAIARFTRGTRNVSAIQHPNVCTIYDFSDTPDGIRFLAMEYVEGETLKEVLDREGRLDAARALEIARQVAAALQAAHDAGVVHRDLKPGNIMLCRRPDGRETVKVVDFDIAKGPAEAEGDEVTRVGFVVGTPEYMSPEQLTGDRLDGRSDLYSLGIVLFRMLSGQLPFRAVSTQDIMIQRLTSAPLRLEEVLPGAPSGLQHALDRALERRREDRQASAAEFAREIAGAPADPALVSARPARSATASDLQTHTPAPTAPSHEPELAPTRLAPAVSAPVPLAAARPAAWRKKLLLPGSVAGAALVIVIAFLALTTPDPPSEPVPLPLPQPDSRPLDPPADAGASSTSSDARSQTSAAESTDVRTTPSEPRQPREPAVRFPGGISAMLDRHQQIVTFGQPGAATLRAVRDSAQQAWGAATTSGDRIIAAVVLAQGAYLAGEIAECMRWARRGAALDASRFELWLQACQ